MRIFISYSRQDFAYARALYADLKQAGYEPWLDLLDIAPGADWNEAVHTAIVHTNLFLLLVSTWSLGSSAVQDEWRLARLMRKESLMVDLQPVTMRQVNAALGDGKEGKTEIDQRITTLNWVDVRRDPLATSYKVIACLRDRRLANVGPFPAPKWLFFLEKVHPHVHLAAWAQLLASIPLFSWILAVLPLLIVVLFQDIFTWVLFLIWVLFGCYYLYYAFLAARNGLRTYHRWGRNPSIQLIELVQILSILWLVSLMPALLYHDLGIIGVVMDWIARLAFYQGIVFVALAILLHFLPTVQLWTPTYGSLPAEAMLPTMKAYLPPSGPEAGKPVSLKKAAKRICLVYSDADRGYAHLLISRLQKKGIQVLPGMTPGMEVDAVVVLLSLFANKVDEYNQAWRRAISLGLPLVTVYLEDTPLPKELSYISWIDARINLEQATQDVLNLLTGQAPSSRPLQAPPRRSGESIPLPRILRVLYYLLGMSSGVKLLPIVWSLGSMIAVWESDFRLEFGKGDPVLVAISYFLLLGAAPLQLMVIQGFLGRQYTLMAMVGGQLIATVMSLIGLWGMWPILQISLGLPLSREVVLYTLGTWEAVGIALLVLVPDVRHWAASKQREYKASGEKGDTINIYSLGFQSLIRESGNLMPNYPLGLFLVFSILGALLAYEKAPYALSYNSLEILQGENVRFMWCGGRVSGAIGDGATDKSGSVQASEDLYVLDINHPRLVSLRLEPVSPEFSAYLEVLSVKNTPMLVEARDIAPGETAIALDALSLERGRYLFVVGGMHPGHYNYNLSVKCEK